MVNSTRETDELERCSQLFDNQNCRLSVSYGLKITRAFFEAKKNKPNSYHKKFRLQSIEQKFTSFVNSSIKPMIKVIDISLFDRRVL